MSDANRLNPAESVDDGAPPPRVRIEFQLNYDEFSEAQLAHSVLIRRRERTLKNLLAWGLFVAIVAAVFAFGEFLRYRTRPATVAWNVHETIIGAFPYIFLTIFAVVLPSTIVRTVVPKIWGGSPHLHLTTILEVEERGLSVNTLNQSITARWATYVRWLETPSTFVLFPSDFELFIVPKRAFVTVADLDTFRELMTRSVESRSGGFPVLIATPQI